ARDEHDVRAHIGKAKRDCAADSAGGAGDDSDLRLEWIHYVPFNVAQFHSAGSACIDSSLCPRQWTEGLTLRLSQAGEPADCIVVVNLAQNALRQSQSLHFFTPAGDHVVCGKIAPVARIAGLLAINGAPHVSARVDGVVGPVDQT